MRAALTIFAILHALVAADLKVKFKVRGYFITSSRSQPIRSHLHAPPGQLSLIALPQMAATFEGYKGFRVTLVNRTRMTQGFEAQDFRINVFREALDPAGRWRAVEYLP